MKNWETLKLIDISRPKQWQNLPINELGSSGCPVYGANGIIGYYKSYNHEYPTIAITCRGASCGNIHLTVPKSYITSNAMALDEIDAKKYHLKFIYYALKNRGLNDVVTGSAQPQITRESLKTVKLTIPVDINDQIRIADLLSQAEGLIVQRKESIRLLDELVKGTFLEMFEGLKQYKQTKLQDVILIQSGQVDPRVLPYREMLQVGGANIESNTGILLNLKTAGEQNIISGNYFFTNEHILYSKIRPYLNKVALPDFEGICSADIYPILPQTGKITKQFLRYILTSPQFLVYINKQADRTSIPKANRGALGRYEFGLPPISLQEKFSNIAEQVESLKKHYTASLKELENLFDSLSQRAFRGELDMGETDEDENDAPPDLPREFVERRKKGLIIKEQTPLALRTAPFWRDLMSKYVIYPTVVDFEDMAVHNWSQYATYYHLFSQVKHQSGQRREAEIIKTGQYVTPEFTFSNTEFFVPFIAETPLDSLFELILFIKENPPSDSDLYQFLPQIEKKTGGQEGFLDLILQNLFTHPETDPKGEKRLSQEMFGKFIEESQEWGIIPEAPYSYLRKYLFDRLHNKATDLEQAFDNTSGEVYLYVKK